MDDLGVPLFLETRKYFSIQYALAVSGKWIVYCIYYEYRYIQIMSRSIAVKIPWNLPITHQRSSLVVILIKPDWVQSLG